MKLLVILRDFGNIFFVIKDIDIQIFQHNSDFKDKHSPHFIFSHSSSHSPRLEQSDFFNQAMGGNVNIQPVKPAVSNFKAYRWQK